MPLITVPTVFARNDNVHDNIFRGDFSKEDGQHEVLGVCQKSSYENRDIVPFSTVDSFPARPDPQIIKRMKVKYVSDEQFEKVKKVNTLVHIRINVRWSYKKTFFSSLRNVLFGLESRCCMNRVSARTN